MTEHACTLDRSLPGGIRECACGLRWHVLPQAWADMLFVSSSLRRRLKDYRLGIEFGDYTDLADAVASSAREARTATLEAHATAERDWIAAQAKKRRKYWQIVRPLVRASGPCAYCGDPEPDCVDHVIPKCQGGPTRMRNLAPACTPCNSQKNGLTPEQWKAKRLAAGLPWPPAYQPKAA